MGSEGFSESVAFLMIDTLKQLESIDLKDISKEQAENVFRKLMAVDERISFLKKDVVVKLQDKEKELNFLEDALKNVQEII